VTKSRLVSLVGQALRQERERRQLTQEKLAILAEVSQATVARIERGDRGVQATLGVEPLDAEIDAQIEALAGVSLHQRVSETRIDRVRERLSVPFVFDGPTAALLQGVPVPVNSTVHLALCWEDADAFTTWLNANFAQRWNDRWEEFGYLRVDPREPGAHYWRTIPGDIRVRMCDALPTALTVRLDDREYPVVPLVEVVIDDPGTARLVERYRGRATS